MPSRNLKGGSAVSIDLGALQAAFAAARKRHAAAVTSKARADKECDASSAALADAEAALTSATRSVLGKASL